MSDPADDRAWAAFRRAVRLLRIADGLWFVPLAVFAGGIVAFELIPNTLDWRGPLWTTFLLLLAALFGIRVLGNLMVKNFPCPRCKHPFVRLSIWDRASLTTIDRRSPCQHCNLPVGAVGGEVDSAAV
jgi:hypothetical protein